MDERLRFVARLLDGEAGGRLLFEVWDRREEIAIQHTASEIVGRALSLDPASLLSPPYHDMAMVRADLAAAGFTNLGFEILPERSRTGSAREAAIATCQGGGCVAISSLTLRIVLKRSPKQWPQLWPKSSVRDQSTPQCRLSCSHRFARLRLNPNVLVGLSRWRSATPFLKTLLPPAR